MPSYGVIWEPRTEVLHWQPSYSLPKLYTCKITIACLHHTQVRCSLCLQGNPT